MRPLRLKSAAGWRGWSLIAFAGIWLLNNGNMLCHAGEETATLRNELRKTPGFLETLLNQWRKEGGPEETGVQPDISAFHRGAKDLSLREVIALALKNNPEIRVQRLNPWLAREDVRKADAVFDPVFSFSSSTERVNLPQAFGLSGVQTTLIEQDKQADMTLKKTLRTGADLSISLSSERLVSNSGFKQLSPEMASHLKVSLNQPLLQDFGIEFAVILVRIAETSLDISVLELAAKLSDLVQRVTEAYWEVARLKQEVSVEKEGVALARDLQRENEIRLKAGAIARVEVKEAEAEVANREASLIVAENALNTAKETLRQLVQLDGDKALLPTMIEPLDTPRAVPYPRDREAVLQNALEQRAEIQQARMEIQNRHAFVRYNENQLLPKLDLEMTYGQNGLSGRPRAAAPETFRGKLKDSLDDAFSTEFNQFFAGVTLEIPFDNAAAKSAYARARIEAAQANSRYRDLVSQVLVEVSKTYGDVESAWKRIQVTRFARELAEEKLSDQEKRYRVGLATTHDLLRFQQDLTNARAAEVKALVDYNVRVSNLFRAEGSLLTRYNIQVEKEALDRKPWWAKF